MNIWCILLMDPVMFLCSQSYNNTGEVRLQFIQREMHERFNRLMDYAKTVE